MKFILSIYFKGLFFFITNKHFRKFLFLTFIYGLQKSNKKRVFNIQGYEIETIDFRSFVWQYYEIFFKEFYKFKETNSNKKVILDCGANIGMSLLYYELNYSNYEIHAYEADKEVYKILQKNSKAFNKNKYFLYQKAIWNFDGQINFNSDGKDGGKVSNENTNQNAVECVDFKKVLSSFNKIQFLKMDIEGSENEIYNTFLENMNKIENLFIEYHSYIDEKQNFNKLLNTLTSFNHRIYIENMGSKFSPLLNKNKSNMDLQLNIFLFKN